MNCIVIDDDRVQQHIVSEYIRKTVNMKLLGSYSNPTDALVEIQALKIDVIFLDVEMPKMSGIEFLEQFKPKSNVILITSNKEYAIDAFENDVIDYLLKPISYDRFLHAVSKVNRMKEKEHLFVKSGGALLKIAFNDILWIQSASEYLLIHTVQQKYIVYSSMDSILAKLPDNFIRVHRSNIVNFNKVESFKTNIISIEKHVVKVSKTYLQSVKSKITS